MINEKYQFLVLEHVRKIAGWSFKPSLRTGKGRSKKVRHLKIFENVLVDDVAGLVTLYLLTLHFIRFQYLIMYFFDWTTSDSMYPMNNK